MNWYLIKVWVSITIICLVSGIIIWNLSHYTEIHSSDNFKFASHLLNQENIMTDNLSNRELVTELFCNLDNINVSPTASAEYNKLKEMYFDKYDIELGVVDFKNET